MALIRLEKYIVCALLALFSVTFLPVNLLHSHAEEQHLQARIANNQEAHSCELDDYACQEGIADACEHKSHISNKVQKCVGCNFHFIKNYVREVCVFSYAIPVMLISFRCVDVPCLFIAVVTQPNKGPPLLS